MQGNSAILSPYGICANKKRLEQQTQRKSSYSSLNNFQLKNLLFCLPYSIAFLRHNLAFPLYLHLNI